MNHTLILSWVTFVYFASFVLYLFRLITGKEFWGRAASFLAWAGLIAQTIALILRWEISYDLGMGHVPLANLYESMIFFAWAIILIYLIIEWRTKSKIIGVFVVPIAFLAMAYASIAPDISNRIEPLIPALQSNWLTSHVVTCFMGYAAFTVAFGCGLIYLLKNKEKGDAEKPSDFLGKLPALATLDTLIYQSIYSWFCFSHHRNHDWFHLGALRLGLLLELGPQRDMVAYHLAYLCNSAAFAICTGLAGKAYGHPCHHRVRLCSVHLPWSQLSSRFA